MDVEFSAEQEALRASVRRFLSERAGITYVRSLWDDPVGTTAEVWDGLVKLGLTGLLVPVRHGGTGAGMVEAGVVLEEMGRLVHPGPYLATAISAAGLLAELDREAASPPARANVDTTSVAELLSSICSGSAVAVALHEPGQRSEWRMPATSFSPSTTAGIVRVSGRKLWVMNGIGANTLLVSGHDEHDELCLAAVDPAASGVNIERQPTVDGTRQFAEVTFTAANGRLVAKGDAAEHAVGCMVDLTAIALAVDGVGAAEQVLGLAVEYAKQRHQFGVPIGSFQAIQHLCADMLRDLEMGRAATYYGLWACDAATRGAITVAERHRAATMAKAFTSDAFERVGASAIQVFGGIGFTWDHDAHLYYKRFLTLQHAFGGTREHLEELARLVVD
ncbi:MAG: acyl-CoA/acyl-ACP dehydrogenase [Acidimicrobiales bacterium]|nr:acyl-CoA/acyl-ACP dehydrogenase [Acidimicrobiales bacterium]